jgi:hypothetical protein
MHHRDATSTDEWPIANTHTRIGYLDHGRRVGARCASGEAGTQQRQRE